MLPSNLFDRSLKVLVRRVAPAFLRLAGLLVPPGAVRLEDVSINLPELRADQVLLLGPEQDPASWALHLEYQLQPDRRVLRDWFYKNAALTRQLNRPVPLLVVYLRRGRRATFPDAYAVSAGSVTNEFRFTALRLWEHAHRVRSGEIAELAPLLLLCEDRPTEHTLLEERDLILGLDAPQPVKADLLAVTIGARFFTVDLLRRFFQEEVRGVGKADLLEWLSEPYREEAREQGLQQGELRGAREILLRQLRQRFGDLPAHVTTRVESLDLEQCQTLATRLLDAASLRDLDL